jgi:CO/xanthine dehydrogenase Mo-binding subunit
MKWTFGRATRKRSQVSSVNCWTTNFPEDDRETNALEIKGIGELGNVGTEAAVANAVYNATRRRVRDLPIRLESLMRDLDRT